MRIIQRLALLEDAVSSGGNTSTAADAASVTSMVARLASRRRLLADALGPETAAGSAI